LYLGTVHCILAAAGCLLPSRCLPRHLLEVMQEADAAAPAPNPATSAAPLAGWSEAEVQHWLGSLGLAQSAAVVNAFASEEVDGEILAGYKVKHVSRILRRAAEAVQDGEALAAAIISERDVLLGLTSPAAGAAVPEAMTPRSTRWGELLFDYARRDERRAALQGSLGAWQPKRWKLGDELGHGSSGVVFACTDKRLGRVAIKFSHAAQPQKLEREAALMQRVAHENICALREHRLLEKGLFSMVLELMDGGSLEQALEQSDGGRLPQAEVVSMALQVLAGLQFMHEQSVIHRDVKPANIMRCAAASRSSGVCYKLIDLSIAAVDGGDAQASVDLETMLQTGTTGLARTVGTPHFMSPEQFQAGVAVNAQTDLWSLGVVIFAAASGAKPFGDGEPDQHRISYAVVNTAVPRLLDMGTSVSESLSDCVYQALQRDRTQRYGSAIAMASALRLATELPAHWAVMDEAVNCKLVPVRRDTDAELWAKVETRIAESLPEFALVGMTRVQNKSLWQKYCTYCAGQESACESELFHYAEQDVMEKIISSSTVSFDPRLGGGEYGAGSYFAQHALYCVAYSAGWLSDDIEQGAHGTKKTMVPGRSVQRERAANPNVTLIWAKVALGHCKDFGARCRSHRGDAAADTAGVGRGLNDEDDWGLAIGRGEDSSYHRPPPRGATALYDSVAGTEGDLAWAAHPRLRERGAEFGRQYVTFDPQQAYPELLLQLKRRPEVTQGFREAAAEEAWGGKDYEMTQGTQVWVDGYDGVGVVCPGYKAAWLGFASTHSLRFDSGVQHLQLRKELWHVVSAAPADMIMSQFVKGSATQLLVARGVLDARYAKIGMSRLAELIRRDGVLHQAVIYREGGVQAVVAAMQAHAMDVSVQSRGCSAVYWLLNKHAVNQAAFVSAGGVEAVVGALKTHLDEVDVQGRGCAAVSRVAMNSDEGCMAVVAAGGVEAVLQAMWAHPSVVAVQEAGCGAVGMLALSAESHAGLVAAGATDAVVGALRAHQSVAAVQVRGCAAVSKLASKSGEGQAALVAAGGAEAVVGALRAHPSVQEVQGWGCAAVNKLAFNSDDGQAALVAAGAAEAVVGALRAHTSVVEVQKAGCQVVGKLCCRAEAQAALLAAGAAEAVVGALRAHMSVAAVQADGCLAVRNLAFKNDEGKATLMAAGGAEAIVRALQAHSSVVAVAVHGCGAMNNVARNSIDRKAALALVAAGGVKAVAGALRAHPSVAAVQEWGFAAAWSLACEGGADTKAALRSVGVAELARTAAQLHPHHAGVQQMSHCCRQGCGL
jgi:serine/threonine protein kinase